MIHKTCSINYGHLADLQKFASDLNKKKLSFDKISPRDFYFFPFFLICTCSYSGARQRRLGRTTDFFMIAYIGIGYNREK